MQDSIFTYTITVRFAETDAMGVVYHGRYFEYLESCRIALLEDMGMPYSQLIELGYHLPVVAADIKYVQSAKFGDSLEIDIVEASFKGPRLILCYRVRNGKQILVEASTTHVFLKDGKATRPMPAFVETLEKYNARQDK